MKISKYNPGLDAYHEIDVDKMGKELKSYNFDEAVISDQIDKAQKKVGKAIARLLGVKYANLTMTVTETEITIVATKSVEEEPKAPEGG
jgi:hypothetical protein